MSWRVLYVLCVFPAVILGQEVKQEVKQTTVAEKIDLPCNQGSFLDKTIPARQVCKKCPENTYWALNVTYVIVKKEYQQKVNGAMCVACAIYLRSPEGSIDVTACVCREGDTTCTSTDDLEKNNLMIILGIIITLIAIGFLIGILFFCRTYGPGIFRMNQNGGHERLETDEEMTNGKSSPDTNLLDIDIRLDYTEEQINDNYNDITAKGDINDMDAVLKAAIISEKRRSRCYSINSMTDLSDAGRYRTRTTSSCCSDITIPTTPCRGVQYCGTCNSHRYQRSFTPFPIHGFNRFYRGSNYSPVNSSRGASPVVYHHPSPVYGGDPLECLTESECEKYGNNLPLPAARNHHTKL